MPVTKNGSTSASLLTHYGLSALALTTAKQTVLSQPVPAGALLNYRPWNFDIVLEVTTPAIGLLPNLTLNLEFNGVVFPLISSAALATVGMTNRRFRVKGQIILNSVDKQTVFMSAEIRQNFGSGLAVSLSSNNVAVSNDFTSINASNELSFSITAQASSLLGGVTLGVKTATIGMF